MIIKGNKSSQIFFGRILLIIFLFSSSCSIENNSEVYSTQFKYSWCNLNDEMDTLDLFKFIKDFELIFNQRKNKQKIAINYLKPEFDVGSYDFLIESTIEVNDKTDTDFNLHDLFLYYLGSLVSIGAGSRGQGLQAQDIPIPGNVDLKLRLLLQMHAQAFQGFRITMNQFDRRCACQF